MARRYRGPFEPFNPGSVEGGFGELRLPRPPRRFWIGLAFMVAAILVIALTAPLVNALTEVQWFTALGLRQVYVTRFFLQFWLFLAGLAAAFLFSAANVIVALHNRTGRVLRAVGIRRRVVRTVTGAIGLGASAAIALILAGPLGGNWQHLALFLHPVATGMRDPVFGLDVSFYLLTLPFLHDLLGWLTGLLFLVTLLVVGLYAWRGDTFDLRLPPAAVAHLSAMLGGIALVLGATAFVGRYDLLSGHDSAVWGAGYTDIHVRLWTTLAQTALAGLLALVLFANVFLRRPLLIAGVAGTWFAAALIAVIYPALVQRITVQPAELSQESPYIAREISFTRQAFGLSKVRTESFSGDAPVTPQEIAQDQATISNLRLWDNAQIQETYQQLQSLRTYYTFQHIDVDRYTINGQTIQLAISARELDQSRLPPQAQNWYNQKLIYTHGYGVAASPVSTVVGEGLPDYVVGDIPPTGPLKITRPQIYFGELTNDYVLVDTRQQDFDYPKGSDNVFGTYHGTEGVRLDGANRLLWAMRTGDFNMLVSDKLTSQSQILFRREIASRVSAIAPYLQLDDNPYIVVVGGRLYWIQDAYTGATTYPYSQAFDDIDGQNYLRNSVKVVVDAYTGAVHFYVADPTDPIIRAYEATFPGLYQPIDQMPAALKAHLRVPPTFFSVQAEVYATYHMSDPATFYNREDVWSMPLQPYYVEMRLPGSPQAEYLQIIPYTPLNKQNLVSWLAVRNDPPHYGEMISYVLPKDRVILGPDQIGSRIQQTPDISRDRTLLNSQGSSVIQGNLLVVPIGDSFLYFEPWYLKSTTNPNQSLPELKKVILTDASTTGIVAYQDTLPDALAQLVGQPTAGQPTPPGSVPSPAPTVPSGVASLVTQALQHYDAAQNDLRQGDLAGYAQEMAQVAQILQQIAQATGAATPSPAPSG
ncbi:MAG TPA: UPF0182 family protein [Candidatus Dormibacteraeota bacterium]|nr:UPF0182 family protein [Candidatus Dormibacteraeota bacterium]